MPGRDVEDDDVDEMLIVRRCNSTSSTAYMVGNIAGDVAASVAIGAATGGAATCGQVANWANRAARGLRHAERAAIVRDGVVTSVQLYQAIRCGDPSAIAAAALSAGMTGAPHISRAAGRRMAPNCPPWLRSRGQSCFLAGTPVWVLREDVDPDEANEAIENGADTLDFAEMKPIEEIKVGDYVLSRRFTRNSNDKRPRSDPFDHCGALLMRTALHCIALQRHGLSLS